VCATSFLVNKRFIYRKSNYAYVAPKSPKGGLKRKTANFRLKSITLRLKKVCYKVFLCENCQRQSCRAFIELTVRAKMIGGGDPLYLKFWIKLTALERNHRFSICSCWYSDSTVTPIEKVQLTLIGSSLRAFQ